MDVRAYIDCEFKININGESEKEFMNNFYTIKDKIDNYNFSLPYGELISKKIFYELEE